MKKSNFSLKLFFLILILGVPLISAQSSVFQIIREQITIIFDIILGALSPIFELIIGNYSTSEFFFAKILLLFLLIVICKNVLDKTPLGDNNQKISWLISIIISILAIRFINETDLISGLLIPYGTLGIAITTILPLIIFYYFVHQSGANTFGRKLFWIFYIIVMVILWISKSDQIEKAANWIYGLCLLAAIILIIFDKTIHEYIGISKFKEYEKNRNKKIIRELKKELDELKEHLNYKRISYSEYRKEKKELEDRIKEFSGD